MTAEDLSPEQGLGPLATEKLENHPLYPQLKALADERGIELSGSHALQQVLEGLSENEGVDARVVFLMGVMLERILHHEESSLVAEDIQEDKAGSLDE
ncbi:hypothetical protein [Salipiger sp. PrR003]|uniref:hypothetical protein n=1 Tax=Salipiger sp. PrR003 TaxID=2706776 RepID=UPI0013DD318A|nr:hypothetical protein [Salipiger sp. PrR003]NDV50793.1 hypothetical protein [Salipiger sp. PrR003]